MAAKLRPRAAWVAAAASVTVAVVATLVVVKPFRSRAGHDVRAAASSSSPPGSATGSAPGPDASAAAAVSASGPPPGKPPSVEPGWTLRWNPDANRDGLGAFEGIEDDRAGSHPGVRHIYVDGGNYRFDMHKGDRDGADRQRNESKGMRVNGRNLELGLGETWRLAYSMFIPNSLQATTSFTHIMQLKMPGPGTAPILVMSLRQHGTVPRIEVKVIEQDVLVGAVDLAPLQNRWITTTLDVTIGDKTAGRVRWQIGEGTRIVLDVQRAGVDTWLDERVRPKWGIYRSLGDTSGSLQDCYLLLSAMRAYQHV